MLRYIDGDVSIFVERRPASKFIAHNTGEWLYYKAYMFNHKTGAFIKEDILGRRDVQSRFKGLQCEAITEDQEDIVKLHARIGVHRAMTEVVRGKAD